MDYTGERDDISRQHNGGGGDAAAATTVASGGVRRRGQAQPAFDRGDGEDLAAAAGRGRHGEIDQEVDGEVDREEVDTWCTKNESYSIGISSYTKLPMYIKYQPNRLLMDDGDLRARTC